MTQTFLPAAGAGADEGSERSVPARFSSESCWAQVRSSAAVTPGVFVLAPPAVPAHPASTSVEIAIAEATAQTCLRNILIAPLQSVVLMVVKGRSRFWG